MFMFSSNFFYFHLLKLLKKDLCWNRSSFHDDRAESKNAWRLTAFFQMHWTIRWQDQFMSS